MTVGLATSDQCGIYLAIESKGVKLPRGPKDWDMPTKIVTLQKNPDYVLLAA